MQITRGQMFLFLRFSTSCLFSGSRQCMPWKIQIKQKKSYHSMEGLIWVTKKLWKRIRKDAWLEHLLHNLIYGALHTSPVASFPGPAQLSVAWRREKWERVWYLITWCRTERIAERMIERVWLCVGALSQEQQKEPRYQVTYHAYLASKRRLSYTPSVECVVGWKYAKCNLLVLQIFAIFWWHYAHVRKDTRLSPLFCTASNGKLGGARERGYKSSTMQYESIIVSILCYSVQCVINPWCYVPHSEFVWLLHSLFPQSFHQLGTDRRMSLPAHVSRQHWHPSVGTNASHFSVLPLDLLCLCACVE